MYERNGEKYFVVDGHCHFWDASPANWVKGQEQYAKGWIECFHAYMGLGPPETHWSLEKFMKYSEADFMNFSSDQCVSGGPRPMYAWKHSIQPFAYCSWPLTQFAGLASQKWQWPSTTKYFSPF